MINLPSCISEPSVGGRIRNETTRRASLRMAWDSAKGPSGRRFVEGDLQRISATAIAEDIFTRSEFDVADPQWRLHDQEMRILALRGVASRYQQHCGYRFSPSVRDGGRTAQLGLDAFLFNRSAHRNEGLQLARRSRPPVSADLGLACGLF
jgi:hypothetical protein